MTFTALAATSDFICYKIETIIYDFEVPTSKIYTSAKHRICVILLDVQKHSTCLITYTLQLSSTTLDKTKHYAIKVEID